MFEKSKSRQGLAGGHQVGENWAFDYQHYTTPPAPSQPSQQIDRLLAQALRLMGSDPSRFGAHARIFQSLVHLSNGWPWPEAGNDG